MPRIEKIDPRVKLLWSIIIIALSFLSDDFQVQLSLVAAVVVSDVLLGGSKDKYKILVPVMAVVASQILVIQILFQREGTLLWEFSFISVYSGFLPAALLGIFQTSAMTLAAVQFITSTSAKQVCLMFLSWNIPYRYAMLPMIARRFLPLMKKEFIGIMDSQAIRGIPQDGIKNKIRNMVMAVMPLLYRAIRNTSDIALSMDLRGYGRSKSRTMDEQLTLKTGEAAGMLLMMVGLVTTFILIK